MAKHMVIGKSSNTLFTVAAPMSLVNNLYMIINRYQMLSIPSWTDLIRILLKRRGKMGQSKVTGRIILKAPKIIRNVKKYSLTCYNHSKPGEMGILELSTPTESTSSYIRPLISVPYRQYEMLENLKSRKFIKCERKKWLRPPKQKCLTCRIRPQRNSKLRFFVDYWKLSSVTVRHAYLSPIIGECIDSLRNAQVFSTLEPDGGYSNPKGDKNGEKTDFTSHHRL